MSKFRLLVVGEQGVPQDKLWATLDTIHARFRERGLGVMYLRDGDDAIGAWARERGVMAAGLTLDRETHGEAASYVRMRQVLTIGRPDLCIAFPTNDIPWHWQWYCMVTTPPVRFHEIPA